MKMSNSMPSSASTTISVTSETGGEGDVTKRSKVGIVKNQMKIFRMKGVVYIHGSTQLYLLQAVHDIFSLTVSEYPVTDGMNSGSGSRFIVIGRHLDRSSIQEGLLSCCVTK
jgi:G3E family GTPase